MNDQLPKPAADAAAPAVTPASTEKRSYHTSSHVPVVRGQHSRSRSGHGGHSGTRSGSGQASAPLPIHPPVKRKPKASLRDRKFRGEPRIAPKRPDDIIPPIGDNIRIIPLGGVEEIGKNCTMIEFGRDIVVIDIGFQFKEESTPGIDYILPNTKYLEDRKDKIRAVIITHGHLDHIGGVPFVMDRIGNPPIYTRNLTAIMLKKRHSEFPHMPPLDIKIIEKADRIKFNDIAVRFFAVTHTIPDSMGIIIETPYGNLVTPGDYKLDHTDGMPTEAEEKEYALFDKEKTLFMMADSTNIENPGFSTPERVVHENLDKIIKEIRGRLIIGTFSSQLERMIKIIQIAEKYNKKIIVEGRSMKSNVEIAVLAGLLTVKKDTIIDSQYVDQYPPDRVIILSTGAQGEEFAALMRMATKAHKNLKLTPRDTVLLSSSIIPGNEKTVQKLKDNLARQGAKIIHYRTSDVYIHSTGHGNRGEIEWLHKKVKPRFFMPQHGHHYMLRLHAELAMQLGMPSNNVIIPDNGSILEIQEKGQTFVRLKEKAPSGMVMVDGFAVGDVQEVVIRDRQMLADDGMFVIVAIVDANTGKLKKSPDLISRGFVYLRESQDLLRDARFIVKDTIEDSCRGQNPINFDVVKANVTDAVSKHLFQETAKKPIVIPVILGI